MENSGSHLSVLTLPHFLPVPSHDLDFQYQAMVSSVVPCITPGRYKSLSDNLFIGFTFVYVLFYPNYPFT